MQSSIYKWFLACRPKTLSGAIIPVMVASACAYSDNILNWQISLLCILFACGMQISSNLINDLFDFLKGTDRQDRLGPKRACAQGWISVSAMKKGIAISIALSVIVGLGILYLAAGYVKYCGIELVAVGALCVLFAYLYTSILSYKGAGDILVLVFFGIVPV
ncbi:MAG: 1,4-dihydroxy-2-naphthoate octaprenyltransferase, partial [Bacteroidia bacterium]|nr:1,4-dihydroxy-2-naphthoate octaprenyltransferase [Bacteroidia bacterium]